jgi:hypothetical protein
LVVVVVVAAAAASGRAVVVVGGAGSGGGESGGGGRRWWWGQGSRLVGPLPWNCFFCFMKFHLPRAIFHSRHTCNEWI